MKRWVNVLDVCLVLAAMWFVLPLLVVGREWELPLPHGNHITAGLSQRNLFICLVVLWIRLHLRPTSGEGLLSRFAKSCSPFFNALLIGVVAFLIYLNVGHFRSWPSGDTIPSKLLPISILEHGSLDLGVFRPGIPKGRAYGLYQIDGQSISAYPPGAALTALPVYATFAVLFPEAFHSWSYAYAIPDGDDLPNVANLMEQVSSSLISALCVVVFWLTCVRVTKDRETALWFTAAYGLGTSLLSTASLALWQHGPACLFLGLMILLLLRAEERGRWPLLLAGLSAGWAYVCRPTAAIVIAIFALWVAWRFRWRAVGFLLLSAVPAIGVMIWNLAVYGNVMGGYGPVVSVFVAFDWRVFLALLFSPSRGIFVFSPFLLFAAVAGFKHLFKHPLSLPAVCLYCALSNVILFSCWGTWAAGSSFGSRYLCEAAMFLSLLMPFCFHLPAASRWLREAFILAVLFSCFVHITGARQGDHGWTSKAFRGDDLAAAWQWRDSQLMWTMIGGRDGSGSKGGEE
jgi:hypothetical protein